MNVNGTIMGMPVQEARNTKGGKITRAAVYGGLGGYAAASMKYNPNGAFATCTKSVLKDLKHFTGNLTKTLTGTETFQAGKKYTADLVNKLGVKNIWNKAKTFVTDLGHKANSSSIITKGKSYIKNLVAQVKNSNVYKKAGKLAQKGFNAVKNSGVGKWAAKNPVAAIALTAAAVAGTIAAVRANKEEQ